VLRAVEELNYHPNLLARGGKQTPDHRPALPGDCQRFLDDLQLDFIASVAKTTHIMDTACFTSLWTNRRLQFTNEVWWTA
jgi:hypothetical protein